MENSKMQIHRRVKFKELDSFFSLHKYEFCIIIYGLASDVWIETKGLTYT